MGEASRGVIIIFNMRKKKTSDPLVSVVILNWNGLEDTLRCIDSVRNLNYANIEIVLVDNGSKNDAAKLEKLASPRMKLIKTNPIWVLQAAKFPHSPIVRATLFCCSIMTLS